MSFVPDFIRRGRRMMANLLRNELRLSHIIAPLPGKYFTKERIERFQLLLLAIVVYRAMLLFQCAEEPFEDEQHALFGIGFEGWCDEE